MRAASQVAERRVRPGEIATAIFSRKVKPGREAEYERWAHEVTAAAARFPGHLNAMVLKDPHAEREYHLVFTFTDEDRLRAWLESPERRRWLARLDGIVDEDWGVQATTGLEAWFELPGSRPPPRWKMWLVSLLAVYPVVLVFDALVSPHVETWPLPLRAALFPVAILTLMTYVVMPIVTRLIRGWLVHGGRPREPTIRARP
jgi:uncharacterized protein